MHRSSVHLAKRSIPLFTQCSACIEKSIFRRITTVATTSPRTRLSNITPSTRTTLTFTSPPPRFSTSAIQQVRGVLNLDDLDEDDDPSHEPITATIRSKSSSSPSPQSPSGGAFGEHSPFLDHTITPPEKIKAYRDLYEHVKLSNDPRDHEQLLSLYRSLADDPDLLPQIQPIDFMLALNSCRDLRHVIPRMRQILEDVQKTAHRSIPEIYHILLKAYIKLSDFKSCSNLIDDMKWNRIPFNTATYHIMLDICKHEGQLNKARRLLEEMREQRIEITNVTYLIMITICARTKKSTLAREYFDEMPLLNLDAEVSHYNALLNAYAHARDHGGAREVFEMMHEDGIQPDQYTYAALVKSIKSNRTNTNASQQAKDLVARGSIKPNAKVLAALGMEPEEIMEECTRNGVEIALHDFNMLIISAIKSNRFLQVPFILEEMTKRGLRPNVFTFTAMLDADIKMGKYQEAKEVFRAMKHANIQPDVIAYSAMIAGALTQASVQESIETLKAMIKDGLLPNRHTFNSLLSASVGEVGIDAFRTIRATMSALRVQPDQRSFNALLSAYALQGDMDEMLRTLDDMKHSKVAPDALTYSILISGFLQNGDLRYSMEWYYKMMEGGFTPAPFVVNNLMAALHGSGQGQQVLMLFREMDRLKIRKNEKSYEIALEACEKYGLDDARQAIEDEFKTYLAWHPSESFPKHD